MKDSCNVSSNEGMNGAFEGVCCCILIGEHSNNIKNIMAFGSFILTFSRFLHQYYVKFQRNMLSKHHCSLTKLQSIVCNELRNLELRNSFHKKTNSSASVKPSAKQIIRMNESGGSHSRLSQSVLIHVSKSKKKVKEERRQETPVMLAERVKQSTHHRLKKKTIPIEKSTSQRWELSNASTKCNDSKEESNIFSIPQLIKKNKQYQQIINRQRDLIQKLEQIIDQRY